MEAGSEIGQKIRSAIKAKLLELGAYVDDELPDYIMVMVANKRSRAQMINDLGLFLADNTDAFTEWLHSLLGKLQTIRTESDKSADKQGNAERLNAVKEKRKVKVHKGDQAVSVKKIKKKADKHDDGLIITRKVTALVGDGQSEGVEETKLDTGEVEHEAECMEAASFVNDHINVESSMQEDVRQLIVTNTTVDALPDELETSESEVVHSRNVVSLGIIKPASVSKLVGARPSLSPERLVKSSTVVRKRRASTSGVDFDKEHAEVSGTVASLVKFATFKPSGPPVLQVNRETDSSRERIHNSQTELQEQPGQPPRKRAKLSDTVHLEDIKQALTEVLERTQADHIAHFSKMVESSLRKLQQQELSLAKLRIQQVLFEFESVTLHARNKQKTSEQATYSNDHSEYCSVDNYLHTLRTDPGFDNSVSVLGNRCSTLTGPRTPSGSPQRQEVHQNSENQNKNSAGSEQQIDDVDSGHRRMSSDSNENHVAMKYKRGISERRTGESFMNRVIFHPKSIVGSLKSSGTHKTIESHSKTQDNATRSAETETALKSQQTDERPQSAGSLSKTEVESPSSVHSYPPSNIFGLNVRRCVTSSSRESTLSPLDLQPKPGSSHNHTSKTASPKSKLSPSILVDSIHNRKRLETSTESASVLKQSSQRDKSPRAADTSKSDSQDSPRHYGPEALKVMAKNLRITVINKRAVKPQAESSSDDSDDDDCDSSDDEDEEENSDSTEQTKDEEATLNKAISGPSTP